MSGDETPDRYGRLTEADTLVIQRLLPGPIERVWSYLVESDKRARWLAAGDMPLDGDAAFTLVWRNDELTDPPGERPPGMGAENRMQSRVIACEAPHRLVIAWGERGEVSFELQAAGAQVLLTVTHRRLPERATGLKIGAGWHAHLDVLAARLSGARVAPFWDEWRRLHGEYDRRFPA